MACARRSRSRPRPAWAPGARVACLGAPRRARGRRDLAGPGHLEHAIPFHPTTPRTWVWSGDARGSTTTRPPRTPAHRLRDRPTMVCNIHHGCSQLTSGSPHHTPERLTVSQNVRVRRSDVLCMNIILEARRDRVRVRVSVSQSV